MSSRIFAGLAVALAICMQPASAQETSEAQPTSGKYSFKLRNGTEFSGFMTEQTTINLLVAGMELKVPMPLVETIRFEGDKGRVRMQLSNGDSVTGQILPNQLDVVADWGTLKINSQSLAQVARIQAQPSRKTTTRSSRSAAVPGSRRGDQRN